MIIYNVTSKVDRNIAEEWLKWLHDEHIPQVFQSGCFVKYQLVKLVDAEELDSVTYATQYYAETQQNIDRYLDEHAKELREKGFKRWGNSFIAFSTIMEVIN
ncbi:MAG: DUF4286 family protein [Chitinophagaceae bacterium]